MLTLYYAPGSCSFASYIALEETAADFETVRLDFRDNQQQSPDYLEVNPKGRVPALVTDKGILSETPAILTYLAHAFPEKQLLPFNDPFAIGKVQSLNAYICATLHVAHAHRFRGHRWADDEAAIKEMSRKAPEVVEECFVMLERDLFEGPFAIGDAFTISDPYLYTVSTWMEFDEVDLNKVPRLVEYRERMKERPAFKRAIAGHV